MQNTFIKRESYPQQVGQIVSPCQVPPQTSPIQQEFEELRDAIEALKEEHFSLRDKLQPVIVIDHSENKPADGPAGEPLTGCIVKDKLAELKQRVLCIKRMTVDLRDRVWL